MIFIGLFSMVLLISFMVLINTSTALLYLFFLIIGLFLTSLFNKKDNRSNSIKIYCILFVLGALYALACKVYMDYNNYKHLLVVDSIETFIPMTEDYLRNSKGILDAWANVWDGYVIFDKKIPGYYTLLVFWGWLSEIFETDFYLTLQLATLFFASFIGVVLYRLFLRNGFDQKEGYKKTLIISLFSILFFYSTIILRDSHISLLYLVAIYLTFKKEFSIVTVLLLFFISLLTATFRTESGLFLFILIPIYLFITLQMAKNKIITFFMSLCVFIILIYLGMNTQEEALTAYDSNRGNYIESDKGKGVIGALNSIPVAGKVGAIVYNMVLPIPCWQNLQAPTVGFHSEYRKEAYNIMRFPQVITAFLNWLVLVHIFSWLIFKDLRNKTKELIQKPLLYQLLTGSVFFYLQATVLTQRRLMGYYCVFYIFFFIIYRVLTSQQKRKLLFWTIASFVMVQIFGVVYLGAS